MAYGPKGETADLHRYAVAKSIFTALAAPRRWAVGLGVAVGRLVFACLAGCGGSRSGTELAYPEMSPEERLRTARGTFESLGRVLARLAS